MRKTEPGTGKTDKLWRDAIRRALQQDGEQGAKELKAMAEALINKCKAGDLPALKEFGDRIDGKAVQPISGSNDDDPISILHKIERVILDGGQPND